MRSAIMAWVGPSCSCSIYFRASTTLRRVYASIFMVPTVTARLSFRRRLPLQSGQGHSLMHSSSSRRLASLWVSR